MIRIDNVSILLGGFSIQSLNLSIRKNEFLMIVGPSGAGKTLMLEAIAGLQRINGGRIYISGRDVTELTPEKRKVALVYQDYALFPHFTVNENIRYGLRFNHNCDESCFSHLVDLLRLRNLLQRFPETLSGGEQQRVALARSLIVNPDLLLLDEPLSALDPVFREEIQDYLKLLHSEGNTIVMVTHDFGEVLSLGERVAVINDGRLHQVGKVEDVFYHPLDRTVAGFVGMKNIFQCHFNEGYPVNEKGLQFRTDHPPDDHEYSFIGVRPEDIQIFLSDPGDGFENIFSGAVRSVHTRGLVFEVIVEVGETILTAHLLASAMMDMHINRGDRVFLGIRARGVHLF